MSEPQASKCDTCPIDVEVRRNTRCCERCTKEHPAYETPKAEPQAKTVQELIDPICLACSGCGHVPKRETINAILKSQFVSLAEYKRLRTERNELSLKVAILHRNLEETKGENNALETRNIGLEDENKQLKQENKEIDTNELKAIKLAKKVTIENQRLEGVLSDIRKHWIPKCKTDDCVNWNNGDCDHGLAWRLEYCGNHYGQTLGVLLNSEASDVKASLKEIAEGKSRKSGDVEKFLKELKQEGEQK